LIIIDEFDQPITSIENFSHEFFYEIFDYLHGCEIYEAFSNLNYRFQQLLSSSSLLFKIKFDYSTSEEIFMNNYKQIILLNKHQIFSIHLCRSENMSQIISSFTIDSLFNRLESLALNQIEPDLLTSLLTNLICLPRLFSLNIGNFRNLLDLLFVLFLQKNVFIY
jgi:hypothetical protein